MRVPVVLALVTIALLPINLAAPCVALAAGGADAAAAEALYNEASAEMEAGKYASACPKLEESFRLDPATGALLTLAACYERAGKLASAWVRYLDVESRANKEGDKDRAAVARQKASELSGRLPRVIIQLGPAVVAIRGVDVRRDGTLLASATLNTALPVDPGPHVVEVSAAGHATARRDVVAAEGRTEVIRIDTLAPSGEAPPPPTPPGEVANDGLTGVQIGGIALGGVGVVALGVGFAFGASAAGSTSDLEALGDYAETGTCPANQLRACQDAFDSASSASTLSTAFVIGGSVLAAAGVVMILVGGASSEQAARLEIGPTLGGGRVAGVF